MATIKRTNIAPLNDQLTVTISKEDYLSTYETTLKKQAKTANIPGFRKGMVPAGMIKKMYGQAIFSDVILKSVEKLRLFICSATFSYFLLINLVQSILLNVRMNIFIPSNHD